MNKIERQVKNMTKKISIINLFTIIYGQRIPYLHVSKIVEKKEKNGDTIRTFKFLA